MKINFYGHILAVFLLTSCNTKQNIEENKPVAKVYDKYLFQKDIDIPVNNTLSDSSVIIKNYIDNWIKRQLFLKKAEQDLSEKQMDISREISDYRTTLLIHRFEEELIKHRLDTVVTQQNIETYYNQFQSEFRLNDCYVKTIYVKIPKSSPDFTKIEKWYRSDKEDDLNDLEDYCFQNGLDFNFDNFWMKFDELIDKIGYEVSSKDVFLHRHHYIRHIDSVYRYYVRIKEYKLVNDIAPLQIVQNDIKKIILNSRKIKLIEEVEMGIYQDAKEKNEINVYQY